MLAIISGFLAAMMLLFIRESYAPILLQRKVDRLRKETGNVLLRSKLDTGLSPKDYFNRGIVRPLKMLVFSPIVLIFAVYLAIVYSYLYLLFTSVTEVFELYYGFSTSIVGLVYLGLGVGSMISLVCYTMSSNRAIKKAIAANGCTGPAKPEIRLNLLPVGAVILPIGFFIYGWTTEYHKPWITPILGMAVIGAGKWNSISSCDYAPLMSRQGLSSPSSRSACISSTHLPSTPPLLLPPIQW